MRRGFPLPVRTSATVGSTRRGEQLVVVRSPGSAYLERESAWTAHLTD